MTKPLLSKLLTFGLLFSTIAYSQQAIGICGTDQVNERALDENPTFKKEYLKKQEQFYKSVANQSILKRQTQNIIEIPVVVHLLTDGTGKDNMTEDEVNAWLDRVNMIFAGTATDIKGVNDGGATLPIKLVLAKRTPDCNPTNGIVSHDLSKISPYVNYGIAYNASNGISVQLLNDSFNWDKNSYYNIYVTNMFDGVRENSVKAYTSGYAYYPGGTYDMAVMLYDTAKKAKDTVLAHEMMHAFNVKHVFGTADGNGKNCPFLVDDNISDTQTTRSGLWFGYGAQNTYNQYKVYPDNNTVNDCISPDKNGVYTNFDGVQHNIMNYGYILDRFTAGQANVAVAAINSYRSDLLSSSALTPVSESEIKPITTTACTPQNLTGLSASKTAYKVGMENVKFGTINKSSSTPSYGTSQFYFDYTKDNCLYSNHTTQLGEGSFNTITLTSSSTNKVRYEVFIDFNNNGIFEDNENVAKELYLNTSTHKVESQIYIPTTAIKNTPLRIRVLADLNAKDYTACGDRLYGEVEDYNVIVTENSNATIWNGTSWSNGLPTSTKNAIVIGDLTITENMNAKSFTIESGSVLVKSGNTLTIENILTNFLAAENFIVESDANILQTSTSANSGEFTVKQNSSPMVLNDATLWSTPVTGQNVRNFSPKTLDKRFYTYNTAENKFSSLFINDPLYPNASPQNPTTYNFVNAKGYHIRVSADQTQNAPGEKFEGKFIGQLNNGTYTHAVVKDRLGFNLIGNPYPSSIDADKFLKANTSISSLYFWTHESPLTSAGYATNNYASYNLVGGTEAFPGGIVPTQYISKAQGFMVKANINTSVQFKNAMRLSNKTSQFYKQNNTEEKIRIKLDLYEDINPKFQILIGYLPDATNGYDTQMDAEVNTAYTGSVFYSLIDGVDKQFVIQGRALPFDKNDLVKLGVDLKSNTNYTIKLKSTENFDVNTKIYLKDNVLNTLTDLTATEYKFDSSIEKNDKRFEIVYIKDALSVSDLKNEQTIAYKNNNKIVVKSADEIEKIELFDLNGRKLLSKSASGKMIEISEVVKSNQIILIKVYTKNQKISTTKIIF